MTNGLTLEEFFTKVEELSKARGRKENEMKDELTGELTMEELIIKVKEWGKARGLDKSDPYRQAVKLQEEVGELSAAILRDEFIEQEDAIGDILVVLINLCVELGISDIDDCLWCAYDEIKDRKGKTVDGIFIKDEDLMQKNEED